MRWMGQNLIFCFILDDAVDPNKPPGGNVCLGVKLVPCGKTGADHINLSKIKPALIGFTTSLVKNPSLTKASRPFEMAMMLEITTGGPCGLRQWLCDTAPPFGCHTTTTTTTFTQTSTLHLQKESFAASFQNPSLRCSGDREHIPWATTNTKCERVTSLRHSVDSAICAYHFQDSKCYVWLGAPKSLWSSFPLFHISPNVLIAMLGIDSKRWWSGPCICGLYRFDCREQYGEHFDSWW